MALPSRYRIAASLCVLGFAISIVVIGRGNSTKSEAATSATLASSPPITTQPVGLSAAYVELDQDSRLEASLRELREGTTCEDRKQAIAKLVALGQTKAVPALEKARTRGKENACLRAAAGAAIRALHGTI